MNISFSDNIYIVFPIVFLFVSFVVLCTTFWILAVVKESLTFFLFGLAFFILLMVIIVVVFNYKMRSISKHSSYEPIPDGYDEQVMYSGM